MKDYEIGTSHIHQLMIYSAWMTARANLQIMLATWNSDMYHVYEKDINEFIEKMDDVMG